MKRPKEAVMVTGAGGFIGSHLAEALLEKNYHVICLLKPGEDDRWLKGLDVTIVYGDITEKKSLYGIVKDITYIYHLAATTGGTFPPDYIHKVNYEGTKNMVDVCIETGLKLKRFLFVSTIAAVGETGEAEYADETVRPNPRSDYGKSKLAAENYIRGIGDKLPFTIVRLPLVYGPRNFHDIFTIFRFAGKGIKLSFGSACTSVGFVKDITGGIILAAEKTCALGQTYFLGEEEAYSYPELAAHVAGGVGRKTVKVRIPYFMLYIIAFFAETVSAVKGTEPFLQRRSLREFLTSNWRFSMKKAREELNFKSDYPLPKGAKITADWYRENGFI